MIFLLYILAGMIAGFLSGLLGIGGGLFIVPALLTIFEWQHPFHQHIMHMVIGTSLSIIIVTAFRSLMAHMKYKVPFWPIYKQLLPGILVGVIGGVILAHYLESKTLQILFAIVLLILALKMLFERKNSFQFPTPNKTGMSIAGFIIGGKSGLLGLGGGALTIPFLTSCKISMRVAVVISIATSFTVAIVGSIASMISGLQVTNLPPWSTGFVYWPAVLCVGLSSAFFAPLGARLSHTLPTQTLKRLFAILLLFISIKMLV